VRKIVDRKTEFLDSSLRALVNNILRGDEAMDICGLPGSAKPFIASLLFRNTGKTILFITPTLKEALDAFRDLSFFLGGEDVLLFPRGKSSIQTTPSPGKMKMRPGGQASCQDSCQQNLLW